MIKANYNPDTGRVCGFDLPTAPYIEITEEERRQPLPNRYSYYVVKNGKFCIEQREPTASDKQIEIQKELAEIKRWFSNNDYKVIKLFLGEWKKTDMEWIEYLTERTRKRERLNELTDQLEKINLQ